MSKRTARNGSSSAPSHGAAAAVEPNLERAAGLVLKMMAIPGKSGEESAVAEFIKAQLRGAGVAESALVHDTAHRRSPVPGQIGNLILKLPGTIRGPRRLLTAHMDTVPICVGSQPKRQGDEVRSADPATGLGADDRAGATVVLAAALEILERGLPHPPLTFCWFIQEEIGLHGARYASQGMLGKPQLAFNWDGGTATKLTIGATGGYRMTIDVRGIASHAGGAPECGVSAIAIASLAIAELQRGGWHGLIQKGARAGTSNVGVIHGGDATNVVTDRVTLRAEARSHDAKFRQTIVREIERAFQRAAKEVKNVDGKCGRVVVDGQLDYEAFRLADDDPSVSAAEAVIRGLGLEPARAITNGGLDANWLTARGIPSVTLGCGQVDPHMVTEALNLGHFRNACRIALRLATTTQA